jgi:hypothetical protein
VARDRPVPRAPSPSRPPHPSAPLGVANLQRLQGAAGNGAVAQLISQRTAQPATVVNRQPDPPPPSRPPSEGEAVTLLGLTHNDGLGPDGEKLSRGPITKLRPEPSTAVKEIGEYPVNTRVIADRKIGTWYHVVVEGTGQTGYMAAAAPSPATVMPRSARRPTGRRKRATRQHHGWAR